MSAGALAIEGQNPAESAMVSESKPSWKIGCFNRPWSSYSYDEALKGMKDAGYQITGMLGDHSGELLLKSESSPEYLDQLRSRVEAQGLNPIMARLVLKHDMSVDAGVKDICRQIDGATRLKLKYVMALGTSKLAEYDQFYQVMAKGAAYAAEKHVQLVFKPHGGVSAGADEILTCLEKVNDANFTCWFDAGNIIYYTGKDPVSELERVVKHVTGFCAKDCAALKSDVMIQFGSGKVDFSGVFRTLQSAHFNGPIMVECCAGKTVQEITENSRANRIYLEQVFKTL